MSFKRFVWERSRKIILILFDIICFGAVDLFVWWTTQYFGGSKTYQTDLFLYNSLILLAAILLYRLLFGVYFNLWRYTNTSVYLQMVIADGLGCVTAWVVTYLLGFGVGGWFFVVVSALMALLTLTSRFVYRELYRIRNKRRDNQKPKILVAIAGAGQLGALLAEELICNKNSNYRPVFFIDKDPAKAGNRVAGLPVYSEDARVLDVIENRSISEIFIAISGLDSDQASELYHFYSRTSCKVKLYDIPMRNVETAEEKPQGKLRNFRIEDLLFRKTLTLDNTVSSRFYRDKVVLVTGGGGSIGSEICRQIAKCEPKKLIVFDVYENNAYEIQQELLRTYHGNLDFHAEIGSVQDRVRLDAVFAHHRPNIVFHAAAHKHVPLMENSPGEAIKNNVLGTYNTADMAEKYGVEKFILISTDKAVNPTNVMGATKRMCEMLVQCRTNSPTCFAAVRFGNVLGSNGSVIPLFKQQIENGGPVTITDKRIIRYFMTIPEASQLVVQAGAMAKKGELFVLDMGKPVRIYDLAVNMIRLSGFEPEVDIPIKEIGLRPGEKLYEELLLKTGEMTKTENNMIFVEKDTPLTREEVERKIEILCKAVREAEQACNTEAIKDALQKVVPTFCDPSKVNQTAEAAEEMKNVNEDAAALVP